MDKNAIKKFAVWARTELISRVMQKALIFGIEEKRTAPANNVIVDGKPLTAAQQTQRKALIYEINQKGYQHVMEDVAYTWFNRFIALRFMEVNGYLPTRVRVFSDENGKFNPQIIDEAIHLDLDGLDMEKVYAYKEANQTGALYRYLLTTQCNALSKLLPRMFQPIQDYTELLLPDNLLREGSVIEQMVTLIPEEDWQDQVQIIGWLYQYYNTEPKDKVFADLKKNIKISKDKIPAATQLFTPDWIVRYMVENSLGRLWLEGHPNEALKAGWKYYLDEAEQEPAVQEQLAKIRAGYAAIKPEDIRVIDPCMGSGHILVYMFDVLVQIYEDYGYTTREAVESIIRHNLYGLDIDDRAAQLAYFAVMMKARQYDRRFLSRKDEDGNPNIPQPHVYAIAESNGIDRNAIRQLGAGMPGIEYNSAVTQMNALLDALHDAKEYGSILTVDELDWALLRRFVAAGASDAQVSMDTLGLDEAMARLPGLIDVGEALGQKYDAVVTNPPYMGSSGMGDKLGKFVKENYPDSKSDLFAVFIERCGQMTKPNAFHAMITQHAWMFTVTYEALRKKILMHALPCLIQFGANAFDEISGEVVQVASFVVMNTIMPSCRGKYVDLTAGTNEEEKRRAFFTDSTHYVAKNDSFSYVPNAGMAYWLSDNAMGCFRHARLGETAITREGMTTADNDRFLRFWYEVSYGRTAISSGDTSCKWYPYNKGGFNRTTESSIMTMSMRLAAAGHQVGLSEAQILGFAAALSSVGIEAEMGGSAFSKALVKMEVAAATGGDALDDFAQVSGMTSTQFKSLWDSDPAAAFQAFIVGLSQMDEEGMSAIATLQDIGIAEVRLRDTLLRAVNATELFAETQQTATRAWAENTALTTEAGKRYATTESQLIIRVVEEDDLYLRDYVNTGIKDLQQIAAAYGLKPDALRVCFAYDS